MQELLERMEAMESALAELRREKDAAERRARRWRAVWMATTPLLLALLLPGARMAVAQTTQATIAERVTALETKVANLLTRLAHYSRSGNNVYITGANLHVRNGLRATNGYPQDPRSVSLDVIRTNGLGNLIIGYNEPRGNAQDARAGSHNLVVGPYHNYQRFGATVVGLWNNSAAPYASVSSGARCTASGPYATVSAGTDNTASGPRAVVSGGSFNRATGQDSWVSGGSGNTSQGLYTSISGGNGNTAIGNYSSVSAGWRNIAGGNFTSVSGGHDIFVSPDFWWAAGSPGGSQIGAGGFTATSP